MTKLNEDGKENLVAGFRKTGIFPLDKSQVLSRLPSHCASRSADGDGVNCNSASHLVSQSFLDHMSKARGDDLDVTGTTRVKRRKVSVVPGKSLSVDDVPVPRATQMSLGHRNAKKTQPKASAIDTTSNTTDPVPSTTVTGNSNSQLLPPINLEQEGQLNQEDTCSSSCNLSVSSQDSDVEPETDDGDVANEPEPVQPKPKNDLAFDLEEDMHVIVNYEGQLYPGQVNYIDLNDTCMT
jgi:hypothetical protein